MLGDIYMPMDNTPTICNPQMVSPPIGLAGEKDDDLKIDRCIGITGGTWDDDLRNQEKDAEAVKDQTLGVELATRILDLLTLGADAWVNLKQNVDSRAIENRIVRLENGEVVNGGGTSGSLDLVEIAKRVAALDGFAVSKKRLSVNEKSLGSSGIVKNLLDRIHAIDGASDSDVTKKADPADPEGILKNFATRINAIDGLGSKTNVQTNRANLKGVLVDLVERIARIDGLSKTKADDIAIGGFNAVGGFLGKLRDMKITNARRNMKIQSNDDNDKNEYSSPLITIPQNEIVESSSKLSSKVSSASPTPRITRRSFKTMATDDDIKRRGFKTMATDDDIKPGETFFSDFPTGASTVLGGVARFLDFAMFVVSTTRAQRDFDYAKEIRTAEQNCKYMSHDPGNQLFACNKNVPFFTHDGLSCFIPHGGSTGSAVGIRRDGDNNMVILGGLRYIFGSGISYHNHVAAAGLISNTVGFLANTDLNDRTLGVICKNNAECVDNIRGYLDDRLSPSNPVLRYETASTTPASTTPASTIPAPTTLHQITETKTIARTPAILSGIEVHGDVSLLNCQAKIFSLSPPVKYSHISCTEYYKITNWNNVGGEIGDKHPVRGLYCNEVKPDEFYLNITCNAHTLPELLGDSGILQTLLTTLLDSERDWILPFGLSGSLETYCHNM